MGVNTTFWIADKDLDLAYIDSSDYDWQNLPDIDDYEKEGRITEILDLRNSNHLIAWLNHLFPTGDFYVDFTKLDLEFVQKLIATWEMVIAIPDEAPNILKSSPYYHGEIYFDEFLIPRMKEELKYFKERLLTIDFNNKNLWVDQG